MTLADLTLPLAYDQAVSYGLLFSTEMAQRLATIQAEVADPLHRVAPQATRDGRFMLCGDVLSECAPGGIFHAGFARLDSSRFGEIEVVPLADAIVLLPAPTPYR